MRKLVSLIALAVFGWQTWCYGATGRLGESEKKTLELTPAVVLVVTTYQVTAQWEFKEGEPQKLQVTFTVTGSGFIYRPDGYIITNGHVVADANLKDNSAREDLETRIRQSILEEKLFPAFEKAVGRPLTDQDKAALTRAIRLSYTTPDLKVYLANRRGYNAEIKAYSDPIGRNNGKDVAILKIDAENLPTVALGDSDQVHVQEPLTVIGYPGVASPLSFQLIGMESVMVPTVTNGRVSAVKSDYKGTPVIQSDAAITHGNSGGPAFNDNGQVIGIATFGPEVAGFNFFVPINTAWEFVRQSGTAPQSGLFNQLWYDALNTYDEGKCQTAKAKFDDVLRIFPSEPDAQRLTALAAGCAAQEGPAARLMEDVGWLPYAVGGIVILGLAMLLLMRRSTTAPAPAAAGAGGGTVSVAPAAPAIPAPPAAPPRSFGSVQVTSGSMAGRRFPITKDGLFVGRDPSKCQIVFPEDNVSKEHAWIVPLDNGIYVIDRGSSNGTFVNSLDSPRVSKVGLNNGDRVYFGKKGGAVLTYFNS